MGRAPYKSDKEGAGALSSVWHLTTKVHPCRVYSILMPSKKINRQTNCSMEPPAASKLNPDGTQHSEQHNIRDHEHGVAHGVHHISYVCLRQNVL